MTLSSMSGRRIRGHIGGAYALSLAACLIGGCEPSTTQPITAPVGTNPEASLSGPTSAVGQPQGGTIESYEPTATVSSGGLPAFPSVPGTGTAGSLTDAGTEVAESTGTMTGAETPSTSTSTSDSGTADPLFCETMAVLQANCQSCHGEDLMYGAPMPLLTYEDLQSDSLLNPGQTVASTIGLRIHDSQRPMPPPPATLREEDKATIDAWLAAGAPAGEVSACAITAGTPPAVEPTEEEAEWPSDCEERYLLVASAEGTSADPYVVPANTEEHPQFYFDAPWGDDRVQLVAEHSITDNAKVLHHWIMYSGGGASGLGNGTDPSGKFLFGWAPGKQPTELPEDVGMYLPSGPQALRLDMHYYNLGNAEDEPDASGAEICVTRSFRKHTATTTGLIGNATVPPGQRVDNVSTCSAVVTPGETVRLMSVSPHMHKLGVHAKLELIRNGQVTVLHDEPFAFEDQRIWDLNNLEIMNGDQLRTTCSYNNPTNQTVYYGDNSDQEMCFNFLGYYPMGAFSCGLSGIF